MSKEAPIAERLGDAPKPDWVSDCGRVVLWNADCTSILPHVPRVIVDAVFTDPPYGIRYQFPDYLVELLREGDE